MEPTPPKVSPLQRFPDHTQAIGMITIEMSALEASCVHLLAAILQTTESIADAILMTPQSTRARLEILKSVADKILPVEDAKNVSKLVSKCDTALNKINSIVHEVWGSDGRQVLLIPIPKGKIKPIKLDELRQQIEALRRLSDKVNSMTSAIQARRHYSIKVTYNSFHLK